MSNDRIYVINLDRSPERFAMVKAQFNRLRLSFERIAAVDAAELSADLVQAKAAPRLARWLRNLPNFVRDSEHGPMIYMSDHHRYLVAAEVACYLSHCRAIDALIRSGAAGAVIAEDDIELDDDFPAVLEAVKALPPGKRIVKFEGMFRDFHLNIPIARSGRRQIALMLKPSTGAAAYYISREAALLLAGQLLPIREQYDAFLRQYWSHGIDVLEVVPFPAKQRQMPTLIEGRNQQLGFDPPWLHAGLLALALQYFKIERLVRRIGFLTTHLCRLGLARWRGEPATPPASNDSIS
jgi:glycosyl transferase, family 25